MSKSRTRDLYSAKECWSAIRTRNCFVFCFLRPFRRARRRVCVCVCSRQVVGHVHAADVGLRDIGVLKCLRELMG